MAKRTDNTMAKRTDNTMAKRKQANNDIQNTTQKTEEIEQQEPPALKQGVNSGALEG